MRSLLLLIDGLGDDPVPALGLKTPFAYAAHPLMDALAEQGALAACSICEQDLAPESCSCISRLLGLPKEAIPRNRAYMELTAHGWNINENQMVLRCNLVAVDKHGALAGFNAPGLANVQMAEAARCCFNLDNEAIFVFLSEYRNLIVVSRDEKLASCLIKPPHENVGGSMDELLAGLRQASPKIAAFLDKARQALARFTNEAEGLHYELYPWGVSLRQSLPSFTELNGGLKGGAVCKAEIVSGLAKALGMEVRVPEHATGDVDTDVIGKAAAAAELLERNDFVLAHFNGTDEAAHRRDAAAKAAFIEQIDREFLGYLRQKYCEPLKIIICGDHVTSSVSGRHGSGKVPVIAGVMHGKGKIGPIIDSYRDIRKFLIQKLY